jgi:hypothetical protein
MLLIMKLLKDPWANSFWAGSSICSQSSYFLLHVSSLEFNILQEISLALGFRHWDVGGTLSCEYLLESFVQDFCHALVTFIRNLF